MSITGGQKTDAIFNYAFTTGAVTNHEWQQRGLIGESNDPN